MNAVSHFGSVATAGLPGMALLHRPAGRPRPIALRSRQAGRMVVAAAGAEFKGCTTPLPKPIKVVGFGGCGVDYMASVAAFPRPDDKLRTEKLEVQGGGNCANALTAAARLGLSPTLVTKIGSDGLGDGIISELQADGVDTQHVLRAPGYPSPFTYIIVDRTGGTRTCIHTPGADLRPEELSTAQLDSIVAGAALVYFDGRLTEAALKLAEHAKAKGVPLLVEAERLRPSLDRLLSMADYVVTSAHFPQDWTGEASVADAVLATAARLPSARFIVTTLGTRGAVLLERPAASETADSSTASSSETATLESIIEDLRSRVSAAGPSVDCASVGGVEIGRGGIAETAGPVALWYSAGRDSSTAAAKATAAAVRAAALNADSNNATGYAMAGSGGGGAAVAVAAAPDADPGASGVLAKVTLASIASLPKDKVVDTTGAGDSFIGSVVYGVVTGMSRARTMQLAAVVAACKCTELGARPGLPRRANLVADLL